MDFIESILVVGGNIACVLVAFSATVILGVKLLCPLTDLIQQGLVDEPGNQDPRDRAAALCFTGMITGLLALVLVADEFKPSNDRGRTVTSWMFNKLVVKGCAEALVALGLIRLVLVTLRAVRQYINRIHCQCCKSGLCDANDKVKG
jgi:hypothetical protein